MTARAILATRNEGKLAELQRILAAAGVDLRLQTLVEHPEVPDVVEDGATFEANALKKARAVAEATGWAAFADDSGLAVDALNGMPGIFSARWSGRHGDDEANIDLLLAQLADVPEERLGAQFVCAAAAVLPGRGELVVTDTMHGRLIRERRGDNGFGYDPIFVPDGGTRTSAEMTAAEKDAISHRGKAFRALAARLAGTLGDAVGHDAP
jgi:XTP/dITP diphosphohydrolase